METKPRLNGGERKSEPVVTLETRTPCCTDPGLVTREMVVRDKRDGFAG